MYFEEYLLNQSEIAWTNCFGKIYGFQTICILISIAFLEIFNSMENHAFIKINKHLIEFNQNIPHSLS